MDDKQAADVFELVGGRMIQLKSVTDQIIQDKDSFQGIS